MDYHVEAAAVHRFEWIEAVSGSLLSGHSITLPILSGSMGARLPLGGTIRVFGCSWRAMVSGDIFVYREGFRLVAHRYLLRLSAGTHAVIYQKGDANPIGGFVAGKQVVGVVAEARDARGTITYSRASTRAQARKVARRQILHVIGYPLKRMVGFFRKIDCRRSSDGDQ